METSASIYLDYNATTPLDPAVLAAMRPYLETHFGNPSSSHVYGATARAGVETARAQVAALLGCAPDEVVFTGGGSESDNLALLGVALAHRDRGDHIVTTQIEHPAVLETCRYLERRFGFRVTYLPVDGQGQVDPAAVEAALTPRTLLVSVMHANNETGVLQPVAAIAALARRHGVLVHTDAAQSVGKVPVDVAELGVDLLTVAGHKLYAPKGVGALYVRRGTVLDPLIHGAGHEGGRRAGTENVAGIVGLGAACAVARERLAVDLPRLTALRDRLGAALLAAGWVLNGHPTARLPNTLNVSLEGAEGEEVLRRAPSVAASTGAACHSGQLEPSAVLLAMGLSRARALGAVRLSLGRWTTEAEVDRAAEALVAAGRAALRTGRRL
ncbi:MAG TPA: cysteine desulfurase family protein [Chloroflexota bacterium]|nr:cysteine desulfurase family protein [Chloroflexota bacterium]